MELIKNLNWRYATKKFDTSKVVSVQNIALLEESIRLSASSYGFQPYKIIVISNKDLCQKLQLHTWSQAQVVDASHLFVFCSQLDFSDEQVDKYLALKSKTQDIPLEKLSAYADFMKGKLKEKPKDVIKHWTAKQTYIAHANLLVACAELKIDSCPLEGFDVENYDTVLNLKESGFTTTVLVAVGYRSDEDRTQYLTKVRKPKEVLFEKLM